MPRLLYRVPIFKQLALILTVGLLAACTMANAEPLAGSEWSPVELAGKLIDAPASPGSKPFVKFTLGRISGNGGCNAFNAAFTSSLKKANPNYGNINVGPILSTRKYCGDGSKIEQMLFEALRNAVRFHRPSGPPMKLKTANGERRFGLVLYDKDGTILGRFAHNDWD